MFFENHRCLACGTSLGFDPSTFSMLAAADQAPGSAAGTDPAVARCAASTTAACNWVVPADEAGRFCRSCALTRTRPPDDDEEARARFVESEAAKRRLVAQLIDLGLPVVGFEDHPEGLAFDLLSSRFDQVMIGHADGVITLDVAEADDAHRERVRHELGEAYRTVLGHLRHEVGHYYWMVLVRDAGRLEDFRDLFGDERADYGDALSEHYEGSAPEGWEDDHVSAYATMHPWEDWAETFAHYLHMCDTLQTADHSGVRVEAGADTAAGRDSSFPEMVRRWVALTTALNALNRSMGASDLYPFVLAPRVIDKLAFVDSLVGNRDVD